MSRGAYAGLNLKWNPFGAMTRAEKQALTVPRLDLSPFVRRLRRPGYALQFLPSGEKRKTTHLLWLRDYFPDAPYICLGDNERALPIPDAPVLFLDQLQEMPVRDRLALFRRPASFALVSHRNHRWEFWLAGLAYDLVPLPGYSAAQMKEALDRRLAWARRDPAQPLPELSPELVRRLLQEHGSELAVLDYLYDRVEELAHNGDDTVWEWVETD